ncbi:hypothetical protein [Lujinxingia sediminis]|uniref:hypothetical protein n=1 Tax=Lujinxingia sediminis TaxID=2480984 RepID=UPI0013E2C6D6|nr:hypothetical protein [Lujinxingia sediminis]
MKNVPAFQAEEREERQVGTDMITSAISVIYHQLRGSREEVQRAEREVRVALRRAKMERLETVVRDVARLALVGWLRESCFTMCGFREERAGVVAMALPEEEEQVEEEVWRRM